MPRTTFSEIITDYAMVEIDDVRLNQDLAVSPARFYRKMCLYMNNAIPRFNRPPAVRGWLQYTPAQWDDYLYTAENALASGATIETGVTGYEMANAVVHADDGCGNAVLLPLPIAYNAENGTVTIQQELAEGTTIEVDFYTDGEFQYELGAEMKRILGLCVQLVWENRFVNAFLLQQPKIKDRSFDVGSEGNHMNAGTNRLRMLTQQLNSELNAFEQAIAYTNLQNHRAPIGQNNYVPFVKTVDEQTAN
ncbi:MAG: hypothetical protein II261_08770 [Bacteroidaceae bacterium]|nr:hypothetical protein [Bacteroidaceae bacterium]